MPLIDAYNSDRWQIIMNGIRGVSQIVHRISLGADIRINNQAPLEDFMKLKDCPFCGSKARIINDYASVVVCSNPKCFISLEAQHEQLLTVEMAIEAWNARTFPDMSADIETVRRVVFEYVGDASDESDAMQALDRIEQALDAGRK